MGKLHRVCIIRRKTGNIPGERYAWIKFTIYDKEKQEMGLFVYRTKNEFLNSTAQWGDGIHSRTVDIYSFI